MNLDFRPLVRRYRQSIAFGVSSQEIHFFDLQIKNNSNSEIQYIKLYRK
jgi:hypothetical protein